MEKNKLIVAVVNSGFADDVVKTAKEAGATGATVISGHGVGTREKTFLGISLSAEKELVFMLVKESFANEIYNHIVASIGVNTDVGGICFCVDVDNATKFASVRTENENEEE